MTNLNSFKRYLGLLWMLMGPATFLFLLFTAIKYITSQTKGDIGNPVPWIIIIAIFTPVTIGLTLFGWYCWKGEYSNQNVNDSK